MCLRRVMKVLLGLVLLAAVVSIVLWRMSWAAPSWYRPASASDSEIATLGEAVENRIIEESHKVRQGEAPWTLRVRSEQFNAWLSSRLPRWLVHEQDMHWPEQVGIPQVRLTDAGVDVALQLSPRDQSSRFVVLRVLPQIVDDRLQITFDRLSLGRVPMPGYELDDLVNVAKLYGADEVLQRPEVQWLLQLLAGRDSIDPVGTLADDRRVRLLEVQLGDDFIDLTLQTLPPTRADELPRS